MRRKTSQNNSFLNRLSGVQFLIWSTVIISLIAQVIWIFKPESIYYFALQSNLFLSGGNVWTIILHLFVHGGLLHLAVNMFVLFSLGTLCERIIGRQRFIFIYLIAGIFAGLLSVILAGMYGDSTWGAKLFGSPEIPMVGASGAIFAIAGLFVVLLPKLRFSIIFLPFFSLPAYVMVPLVLLLTWFATVAADLPIGNVAHVGGFIAGLCYGFYLRIRYRAKVQMLQRYFR